MTRIGKIKMGDVEINFPVPDDDALSAGLRRLTKAIHAAEPGKHEGGFGLGGEHGYGANFENETFLMHQFCWCEREDCLWCGGSCGCESRRCGHYLDGKEISEAEYERWHATICKPLPWEAVGRDKQYVRPWDPWKEENAPPETPEYVRARDEFDRYIEERDRRSGRIFRALVHSCSHPMFYNQVEDIWAIYAPQPYPTSAPHFWHKPSGTRVWWYKYIGRDMVADLKAPWPKILRECRASLRKDPR